MVVIIVSKNNVEYKRLDMSKLIFANEVISTDEALKDITPVELPNDVISGKRNVINE
jgi:hypothetical protein